MSISNTQRNNFLHDFYDDKWKHYYKELRKDIKDNNQAEEIADRLAMEDVYNLNMEG